MKLILKTVFAFLLISPTLAQSDQDLAIEHAINARTITEIQNYKGKFRFVEEHHDLFNSEIIQTNWQLGKRKKFERIGLLTLSINSEIIYSKVYQWDLNEQYFEDEENEPLWNYVTVNTYTTDQFSDMSIDEEHLTQLPFRSTFGYACYAAPQMPTEGKIMMELVNNSSVDELTNWLISVNPVRQAFAYLGFSLLEARGLEINENIKSKMKELPTAELSVFSCSGCTLWESTSLTELLSNEKVQRFIEQNLN